MKDYELKPYTAKIKQSVQRAMLEFCQNECYLVKRRKRGKTSQGQRGQCHTNVDGWVKKKGGQRIPCWILLRDNALLLHGIWIWCFHSVWKTPEGEIVDVTNNPTYEGKDFTTVWFDSTRDADLIEGTSFNNLVVFENISAARPFSRKLNRKLEIGVPYWVTPDFECIMGLKEHSGICRWVDRSYPKNRLALEETYGCKIINDRIVPTKNSPNKISSVMFLDFSL